MAVNVVLFVFEDIKIFFTITLASGIVRRKNPSKLNETGTKSEFIL